MPSCLYGTYIGTNVLQQLEDNSMWANGSTVCKKKSACRVFAPRRPMCTLTKPLSVFCSSWHAVFWVQPVVSLGSFCTSHWAGWPGTGNTADDGRHEDASAPGETACRRHGACCYEAKLWGWLPCTTSKKQPHLHLSVGNCHDYFVSLIHQNLFIFTTASFPSLYFSPPVPPPNITFCICFSK